ncbi:MAG: hypothetical protein PF488_00735 [Patescibacteria group bacterium]|jgi:hypothetical protein|nr:hypothetical protein [Patescibacteria group bacterium]
MKKTVIILVLVSFVMITYGQRNQFYYGDKTDGKISESINKIDEEIENFQDKVDDLDKENDKLYRKFDRTKNARLRKSLANRIYTNDSLIVVYRKKLSKMEDYKITFIKRAAGKDKTAYVKSIGSNPSKIRAAAEAYATMAYTDAYIEGNMGANSNKSSQLTGIVINHWYIDVHVIVTGPGFNKEYYLKNGGGNEIFDLPMPGIYKAVFYYNNEIRVVRKKVLPGPNRGLEYEGENYNFSAMLYKK